MENTIADTVIALRSDGPNVIAPIAAPPRKPVLSMIAAMISLIVSCQYVLDSRIMERHMWIYQLPNCKLKHCKCKTAVSIGVRKTHAHPNDTCRKHSQNSGQKRHLRRCLNIADSQQRQHRTNLGIWMSKPQQCLSILKARKKVSAGTTLFKNAFHARSKAVDSNTKIAENFASFGRYNLSGWFWTPNLVDWLIYH